MKNCWGREKRISLRIGRHKVNTDVIFENVVNSLKRSMTAIAKRVVDAQKKEEAEDTNVAAVKNFFCGIFRYECNTVLADQWDIFFKHYNDIMTEQPMEVDTDKNVFDYFVIGNHFVNILHVTDEFKEMVQSICEAHPSFDEEYVTILVAIYYWTTDGHDIIDKIISKEVDDITLNRVRKFLDEKWVRMECYLHDNNCIVFISGNVYRKMGKSMHPFYVLHYCDTLIHHAIDHFEDSDEIVDDA